MRLLLKAADERYTVLLFDIAAPASCADGARCAVSLNGVAAFPNIIGIDPMNAMENAIAAIRAYLAATGRPYVWEDGRPHEALSGD